MRRLTAVAAAVLIAGAGCSEGDEPADDTEASTTPAQTTGPAPSPTAHLSVEEVFQLEVQAPEGFTVEDVDRDALVADDHLTTTFALTDGHGDSRLMVTSYLLPEGTSTDNYDSQVGVILAYDDARGNTISSDKHTPTLVHGYPGVYRFAKYELGGEEVSQQNHYLFAGRHLIQITCQWNYDFSEIYRGCRDIAATFAYPAEWPLPYSAEA